MADPTVHFSIGWMLGSAVFFVTSLKVWLHERLSIWFKRWYQWSYGVGLFAIIPGILQRIGVTPEFCTGWWMNLFVLHPLIDRLKPGGVTLGPLMLAACLGTQYAALLFALYYYSRKHRRKS